MGSGARKGSSRGRSRSRHLGWKPTRPPHPALGTMGLGARGGWAFFIVGALLVLALLKVAVDSDASEGKRLREAPAPGSGGSALPSRSFQAGVWWRGKFCVS